MNELPDQRPFSESDLDSPEYRERLRRKLNCLIALLEVAMARIRRSLSASSADAPRLERIRGNLESTLEVCLKARTALERSQALPESLGLLAAGTPEPGRLPARPERETTGPELLREILRPKTRPLPEGAAIELASAAERRKFERMGPIGRRELEGCDLDQLARQLQGD
jgi:hypothetical protein